MSPEQILGEPLDARTDIFSLGVVLYQLIAGVRPFDGPDTKTTAQRIRHSEPPHSLVDVLRTSGARSAFERIMMRCIEKLPGDRFASAREVASSLEASASLGDDELRPRRSVTAELLRAKVISSRPRHRRSTQRAS